MSRGALRALPLLAMLLVAGCGIDEQDSDPSAGQVTQVEEARTQGGAGRLPSEPRGDLPQPRAGAVTIEGQARGSLTSDAIRAFDRTSERAGLAVDVQLSSAPEERAISDLCAGRIDIADSARPITSEEVVACRRNGLQIIEVQVASDAIVLATKNETDVGADCLTTPQVREIFRSGSPIRSWSQLNPNFFPLRLTTVGPDDGTNAFDFFGQQVLGVPNATRASLRADYDATSSDREIRDEVVENPPGVLSIFRFTFYEQFEEDLRPLEIDNTQGDACVFPSQDTITTGLYPLARRLRLYTTQRSLQRTEVQEFLRDVLQRAPDLAVAGRLIPIPEQVQEQELAKIDNPQQAERDAREADEAQQRTGEAGANAGAAGDQTTTPQTTTGADAGGDGRQTENVQGSSE